MAVPGSVVAVGKLITPGGQQGPQGVAGSTAALADITQNGLLRQTPGTTTTFVDGTNNYQNLVTAIDPEIWSVRLRSLNAAGNPNFECDQKNVGNLVTNPANAAGICDRWFHNRVGTMAVNVRQFTLASGDVKVPGTNFCISRTSYRFALTTQQASLGAADTLAVFANIEGPQFRELQYDVHSLQLLVRSGVAGLKFAVTIRDSSPTKCLSKLCTAGAQDAWTLITLPNLPVFPAGNFSVLPGAIAYQIVIALASGSSLIPSANDTWQTGSFSGAVGMDNWCSKPVNSYFDIAFVQHEPGPVCTTLMDKPFTQNYDECLRYYTKSYPYGILPGTSSGGGAVVFGLHSPQIQQLSIPVSFPKVMAKAPTVTGYSITGAINNVRDIQNSADRAISAPLSYIGDRGFGGFLITGGVATPAYYGFHYIAETGM